MRYFIIDYGHDIDDIAKEMIKKFRNTEDFHIVVYKTDAPTLLTIEEVQEYEFISHYAKATR